MDTIHTLASRLNEEEGHAVLLPGMVLGAAGLIALGIGAANDTGWLAVTGGIVAAAGFIGYDVTRHMKIDYKVFGRLEDLERKK
jgi:hypothetical protein